MPVDIDKLAEGWLELESDPGLFTLLLEDFGVREVEVREVYDVSEKIWNEGLGDTRVFGFIFLFRWNPGRNRGRRKHLRNFPVQPVEYVQDKEVVNSMFFARQMVQNSCATHALLSVVLNCPDIDLGPTLERLRAHTSGMDPENKGWAIANTPQLARDHNAHASPQAQRSPLGVTVGGNLAGQQSQPGGSGLGFFNSKSRLASSCTSAGVSSETFHFVSYVPINGRLYELDGLKPYPIDHGPVGDGPRPGGDWTAKFRKIIMSRLGIELESGRVVTQDDEIHFSLMAVIPHQGASLVRRRARLEQWKHTFDAALDGRVLEDMTEEDAEEEPDRVAVLRAVVEELRGSKLEQQQQRVSECDGNWDGEDGDAETATPPPQPPPSPSAPWDTLRDYLLRGYAELEADVGRADAAIREEAEKQGKYRLDDARRAHNYDGFITTFLAMLAAQGKLDQLIRDQYAARGAGFDLSNAASSSYSAVAAAVSSAASAGAAAAAGAGLGAGSNSHAGYGTGAGDGKGDAGFGVKRAPLKRVNSAGAAAAAASGAAAGGRKAPRKKRRGRPKKAAARKSKLSS